MFDRVALIAACKEHGTVARVVVADVAGSAPREVGAAMLVWDGGQSGTIGGGALEYELARTALNDADKMTRHALGPDMGQCCGGSVHILTEVYDLKRAEALATDIIVRGKGDPPLQIEKLLTEARNQGQAPLPQRVGSWFIEPVQKPSNDLWIWGAGHVGRALVNVLSPLAGFKITWVDTDINRFPHNVPSGATALPAKDPTHAIPYASVHSHHLILTYSHNIDLDLCHGLLGHGFASCGLIGSATKWTRFRKRLSLLGHTDAQISRIMCPIGDPSLGKHPQMIAIGVANQLLKYQIATKTGISSHQTSHRQEATA
jgi:xanthine dehydrogenase accessory factor